MKHTILKKMTAVLMVSMAMTSIVCLPAQATTNESQQVVSREQIVVKTKGIPVSIVSSSKNEVEFNVAYDLKKSENVNVYNVTNLDETKNKSVVVSIPAGRVVNVTVVTETGNIEYKTSNANLAVLKTTQGNITIDGQATRQLRAMAPNGTVTVSESKARSASTTKGTLAIMDKNTRNARARSTN